MSSIRPQFDMRVKQSKRTPGSAAPQSRPAGVFPLEQSDLRAPTVGCCREQSIPPAIRYAVHETAFSDISLVKFPSLKGSGTKNAPVGADPILASSYRRPGDLASAIKRRGLLGLPCVQDAGAFSTAFRFLASPPIPRKTLPSPSCDPATRQIHATFFSDSSSHFFFTLIRLAFPPFAVSSDGGFLPRSCDHEYGGGQPCQAARRASVGSLPFPFGSKRSLRWKSFVVNKTGFENRLDPSGRQENP